MTTAKRVAEAQGSSVPRVKVPDNGSKSLRILQPLEETAAHYVHYVSLPGVHGGKGQFRSFECLLDDDGNGRCPLCDFGDDKSRNRVARIILLVMDRKPGDGEKAAGVMEVGARFFKDLEVLEEEFGPVTGFDIRVTVTGAGQQRKYSVMPTQKRDPFGPTEQGALESIDLTGLIPDNLTYDKVKQQFENFTRSVNFDSSDFGAEEAEAESAGDATDDF